MLHYVTISQARINGYITKLAMKVKWRSVVKSCLTCATSGSGAEFIPNGTSNGGTAAESIFLSRTVQRMQNQILEQIATRKSAKTRLPLLWKGRYVRVVVSDVCACPCIPLVLFSDR